MARALAFVCGNAPPAAIPPQRHRSARALEQAGRESTSQPDEKFSRVRASAQIPERFCQLREHRQDWRPVGWRKYTELGIDDRRNAEVIRRTANRRDGAKLASRSLPPSLVPVRGKPRRLVAVARHDAGSRGGVGLNRPRMPEPTMMSRRTAENSRDHGSLHGSARNNSLRISSETPSTRPSPRQHLLVGLCSADGQRNRRGMGVPVWQQKG